MGGKGGGGGKKGGASTPAPDFSKAAMVNQYGPAGSATWKDGALTTQFTGPMAGAWGGAQSGMEKAASYDPTQARDAAITSNYNQGLSRLQPLQQQEQQRFTSGAANMGLDPGQQAYQTGLGNMQRNQTDQMNSLMANAIRQGNETQQVQMEQMRQPFLQGGMMMNMLPKGDPSAPFKAANAQYEAGKDATSAQQGKKGQTMGGLGSLAGTVFGGPIGGMIGGAAGNMLGGGTHGSGKKGATQEKDFAPGGAYEGYT
jgi:hypothetical protein